MTDPRLPRIADLLLDRCLEVQPRWQVTVRATPLARPLVEEVARALGRRGAYYLPSINWWVDRVRADLTWALEAPLDVLGELSPLELHQVEHEDARLVIRAPEDARAGAELDPTRVRAVQQAAQVASQRTRSNEVKWVVTDYPTEAGAARAGMPLDEYTDFVLDASLLDWDAEEERMGRIKERFDAASTLRITGGGTDLTLRIEGREGVVSAGFRNMPDGEVFYSPVEDTAEGVVHFAEFPAVYLGHDVVGARLVFQAGEVIEATADEGEEFLRGMLATDDGAKRLGELGIGCNPRITRFTRNVLFDEKIDGTIHLALGASYTYTGGRNESAIHWDMVKDLRPGGEIHADGELVQQDGRWLI